MNIPYPTPQELIKPILDELSDRCLALRTEELEHSRRLGQINKELEDLRLLRKVVVEQCLHSSLELCGEYNVCALCGRKG